MPGSSLGNEFTAPSNLPGHISMEFYQGKDGEFSNDLSWRGSHQPPYSEPGFIDANDFFDLEDGGRFNNSTTFSPYPPLTGLQAAYDHVQSHAHAAGSQFDPLLPAYPVIEDNDLIEDGYSRSYTNVLDFDDIVGRDVLYQSIEHGLPATVCGEGSRRDTSKDDELLQLRSQGISYREIKQKYGFTEAESTLRGRYRTLTKSKDKRVRKPTWKDKDVS